MQVLFGRGTLSELAFSTTLIALGSALTFWLAARASGSIALGVRWRAVPDPVAAAVLQLPEDPGLHRRDTGALVVRRPSGRRPIIWLAAITVIGFLLRHDHVAFVGLATVTMLLLAAHVPWRERLRHGLLYAALSLAMVAPYLVFIQLNGGLNEYRRQATEWAGEERARTPVQWPGLFDNPDGVSEGPPLERAVASVRDNRVAWLYHFEIALPILALLVLGLSRDAFRPGWPHAMPKIVVVAILGLILDAGFLRSPLQARVADPTVPHAILLAWLAMAVPRLLFARSSLRPAIEPWAMPVRVVAILATISVVFVFSSIFTNRLSDRFEDAYLTEGPRVAIARARTVSQNVRTDWDLSTWRNRPDRSGLMTLALYLNTCTPPEARVFIQPYLPQVLGMAQRGFAAGFGDLRPGFFDEPEFEALAMRRMRGQDVPVVLLDVKDSLENFRESFPTLTAYFDAAYETVATETFDDRFGVTLLVKRGRQGGTFDPLGWPCPAVPR